MLKVGSCGVDLTLMGEKIRILKRCFDGSSLFRLWQRAIARGRSERRSPNRSRQILFHTARNLTRVRMTITTQPSRERKFIAL